MDVLSPPYFKFSTLYNIKEQRNRVMHHKYLNSVDLPQSGGRSAWPRVKLVDEHTGELVSAHQLHTLRKVRLGFGGKCANEVGGDVHVGNTGEKKIIFWRENVF